MVATFDFSTLYTDLIYGMVALFNRYFGSDLQIRYSNRKLTFEKSDIVNISKFSINNSFVAYSISL